MADQCKLKIIVLGEAGVGKTSVLLRYTEGMFKEKYSVTNVDRIHKAVTVQDKEVMLELWDTAGSDRFRAIVRCYFRDADGVLLIYDVTDITTFHKLSSWLSELRTQNETATVIIVGNKNEESDKKMVSRSTVKAYARDENLDYIETSAKSGENINKVFESLTLKILKAKQLLPEGSHTFLHNVNNSDEPCKSGSSKVGTDCSDNLRNNNVTSLPPIVSLQDDDVIKLCVEKTKMRKDDDFCCVIS